MSNLSRPGDHVIWKAEDQKRAAIVQSVNAVDRTAQIRCADTGTIELASVLELDPHGTSDWSAVSPTDGLGVNRGDFVFIHKEGATNGVEPPMIPRIGEVEEWVREPPEVDASGHLGGWRREMADIGNRIAERRGKDPNIEEGQIQRSKKGSLKLNWFGEVTEVCSCVLLVHEFRLIGGVCIATVGWDGGSDPPGCYDSSTSFTASYKALRWFGAD